jgi:hypothetical protein
MYYIFGYGMLKRGTYGFHICTMGDVGDDLCRGGSEKANCGRESERERERARERARGGRGES